MAIPWNSEQRESVAAIQQSYPPKSGRCEDAARETLPVARDLDPAASAVRIEPAGHARFVVPKAPLDEALWRFHVTVEARAHHVDALTGPDGTPVAEYFSAHWECTEAEAYRVFHVDLEGEAP
ncbi:hypothetical protein [Chondromyces apiculatus]|uniref:Uncharacterized protein n=1 Tax=Chondromyces apiculatus DSM 436 TaxID=1192034 RepID=A0A017SUH7_9BACT|nr:hypothetical protein [Chondromyces apiculatus]EYF00604.1 Hypothetical protein CAP_0419 [Chondromyces apiculatus DSM 436]